MYLFLLFFFALSLLQQALDFLLKDKLAAREEQLREVLRVRAVASHSINALYFAGGMAAGALLLLLFRAKQS